MTIWGLPRLSSHLTVRKKSQIAPAIAARVAAKSRPEVVTVTEDESDSDFISDTEDPEAVERNRTAPWLFC